MKRFNTISDINRNFNIDPQHPLIDIRRYADIISLIPSDSGSMVFDFYKISFVNNFNGYMKYGQIKFSGENGILYFVAPGQEYSCTSTVPWDGYQILIHSDIFRSNFASRAIDTYRFFSYDVNESLLLTPEEEHTIEFLMHEVWDELNNKNDEFSIGIVLSYISSLLNTSERFYARQFHTRKHISNQIAHDFFTLLNSYYSDAAGHNKQPTVLFFSEKLNITANYLSDTLKFETGKPALAIIHEYVIEEAKKRLASSNKTVAHISDALGFEYPGYFSRLFKKKTSLSPSDFRKSVKRI